MTQTYRNMEKIQDRITGIYLRHIPEHPQERLEELMLDTSQLVKDVGTHAGRRGSGKGRA